jgi:hypothetical protein
LSSPRDDPLATHPRASPYHSCHCGRMNGAVTPQYACMAMWCTHWLLMTSHTRHPTASIVAFATHARGADFAAARTMTWSCANHDARARCPTRGCFVAIAVRDPVPTRERARFLNLPGPPLQPVSHRCYPCRPHMCT